MKISSLIIDDDVDSRMIIDDYIKNNSSEVVVVGHASTVKEAICLIEKLKPDLLVLDIVLPDGTAFDLLKQLPAKDFEVIFITGYDAFAIQAFKFSALDYLLKPVAFAELKEALLKVGNKIQKKYFMNQWEVLLQMLHQEKNREKRLAIATADGFVFTDTKDIMRMESHSNYTHFYFVNGKKLISSHTLGFYEEVLSLEEFCRIHHSHLVNIAFVGRFAKNGVGGIIVMKDGTELPVSQRRKDIVIKHLVKNPSA